MIEKVIARVGDKDVVFETGKIARQADGAVTVQLGETIILVAAVAADKPSPNLDFFPLTVDYREKAAAAGRFPGGYFKREGRPSEKEILTSRMIDRPIRPLFPKGWLNEVQIQAILLSADGENDSDILAVNGASAALMLSDIPWAGPIGAVRIGRVGGRFIVNPTHSELEASDLDLVYVGTERELIMFEGSAREIPEADLVAAMEFAHQACQPLIAAQKELAARAGKPKRAVSRPALPENALEQARSLLLPRLTDALLVPGKLAREAAVNALLDQTTQELVARLGADVMTEPVLKTIYSEIIRAEVRRLIMDQDKRLDGRALDQLRPIWCEVGVFPRSHGSAIFCRGETQVISLATLGTEQDIQEFDAYAGGESEKRFLHHYNFPHFSVGETGRIAGPGRREIGHGALAERSLAPLLPDPYPYTIRITCEVTESNGSTSMAAVCGGALALMDAGIPIARPAAGISIGLCTEHAPDGSLCRYKLLTDIIGWEDAYGDMDCKIAGTERGVTGFQLDLKLTGVPIRIIAEAIERARVARMLILDEMRKVLPAPRPELSKYAPRLETIKINPEKIGVLIGPGGKNIKKIVDESGCEIDIEEDGTVKIFSTTPEGMEIARKAIAALTEEIEIGKTYRGKVVSVKDFGVFVEVLPGKDGFVHVSELANFRVKNPQDIVKVGDEIWVKCVGIDEQGRVRLSRKQAMAERDRELGLVTGSEAPREQEPKHAGGGGGHSTHSSAGRRHGRDRERGGRHGRR